MQSKRLKRFILFYFSCVNAAYRMYQRVRISVSLQLFLLHRLQMLDSMQT